MAEKGKYYENQFKNLFGPSVVTPVGRIQFVNLAQPSTKFQPPKYGCTILFDKKDEAVKKTLNSLVVTCNEMAAQKYGAKKVPAFKYPPFRNGDSEETSKYQGFAGHYTMGCKSKRPIEIIDAKKQTIDAATILPGMLVRAIVTPILFDDGFAWQAQCIQLVKDDGVRYFGGADPKSLFDALEDTEVTPDSEGDTLDQAADKVLGEEAPKGKSGKAAAVDIL